MRDDIDNDSGLLEPDESLEDRGVADVLDEGYSPPERPIAAFDWGVTAREVAGHEPLARRLAREVPDIAVDDEGDGIGDSNDTDGEPYDDEVGVDRAGRLIEGADEDTPYAYLYARDIGVDGSAASAEEAAIHIVRDDIA
ncbi:DUF5709 domain-containing protein [Labedaea rhizosphaerae]|uniref:DUF5709 domain-containing protein n=1 Tax=Labedaea rhizosphaerae TaxID=598644 RepID=A0A4R6RUF2_LABRH|nr:DUF5709 domain-containing protein [Labedaea rhizosphaerae]TDP90543.1 hypothetical protein EV186_11084 [Labedaea rhizosphaerae]